MNTGTLFIVIDRIDVALACGADGVAVISVVVGSRNITAAARKLRKRVSESRDAMRIG
jgi:thiamine monophosphate synthase